MSTGVTMTRSNPERSAATRDALLTAAQELFARDGFSGTSTEKILATTGMTRGALYHHFRDKSDLFSQVCERLHRESAAQIEGVARTIEDSGGSSLDILRAGCETWLMFMAQPKAHRILIVDAPSVLGWSGWQEMDRRHGYTTLVEGVLAAQIDGLLPASIPVQRLAQFLNGAMNQAVLAIGTEPDAIPILVRDFNVFLGILSRHEP
jgi:AcrR family transcriptional regulator